jgi:protein-L-isoaspartate(D-aspartate) O-methyltransferase
MRRTVPVAAVLLLVVIGVGVFFALRPFEQSPGTSSDRASLAGQDGFAAQRVEMVERQIAARGVEDRRVLAAMTAVPRHEFVPSAEVERAYSDGPLPIGFGQTISQPYIVALMTELAQVRQGDKVLEIGTGSGYQAAVLAELTDRVYSVEIVPELARGAAERLRRAGYTSARVRDADGYFGWERHAPFDAILVTAAPDHVPPPLIRQLREGGRMVIPVGQPGSYQTLWRIRKTGGTVVSENVTGVAFVPLTREAR